MKKDSKEDSSFVRASGAFGRMVGRFKKKIIVPVTDEVAEIYDDLKKKFSPKAKDFYENVLPEKIKTVDDIYQALKNSTAELRACLKNQ